MGNSAVACNQWANGHLASGSSPAKAQRLKQEVATDERVDWPHDVTCACVARGDGDVGGYPSCVLPEPDVDK